MNTKTSAKIDSKPGIFTATALLPFDGEVVVGVSVDEVSDVTDGVTDEEISDVTDVEVDCSEGR
jgi:hypothetical protein